MHVLHIQGIKTKHSNSSVESMRLSELDTVRTTDVVLNGFVVVYNRRVTGDFTNSLESQMKTIHINTGKLTTRCQKLWLHHSLEEFTTETNTFQLKQNRQRSEIMFI